jgi:hypothetical protein
MPKMEQNMKRTKPKRVIKRKTRPLPSGLAIEPAVTGRAAKIAAGFQQFIEKFRILLPPGKPHR